MDGTAPAADFLNCHAAPLLTEGMAGDMAGAQKQECFWPRRLGAGCSCCSGSGASLLASQPRTGTEECSRLTDRGSERSVPVVVKPKVLWNPLRV